MQIVPEALRRRLVEELETRGAIRTDAVRAAFLAVPRERFLPEVSPEAAYRDDAIPTKFSRAGVPVSSSSQPAIMAEMLELLDVERGVRVLEIGAGTGYNAALLAELGARVDTIDIDADTARRARHALRSGGYRVRVLHGDGREKLDRRYARIVVTASADGVPQAWFEELVEGGILVVPLRLRDAAGAQVVAAFRRDADAFRSTSIVAGGFMPLRDEDDEGLPPPLRHLQATDLTGGAPEMLCHLAGAGLARMSAAARRRLLALALERPRVERLRGGRGLVVYLSTTLPAGELVSVLPEFGVGLAARNGSGLAYATSTALKAHGSSGPRDKLQRAIDAWTELGRPGLDALAITVEGSSLTWRWRRATSAQPARPGRR